MAACKLGFNYIDLFFLLLKFEHVGGIDDCVNVLLRSYTIYVEEIPDFYSNDSNMMKHRHVR